MTLQDLIDRAEIEEVLAQYCHLLDQQRWDAFRALFTEDARLDYIGLGEVTGPDAMIAFLQPIVEGLAMTLHAGSTNSIALNGDTATVRSAALVPMTAVQPGGALSTSVTGLWYEDEFRRTPAGWRIAARRQVPGFSADFPLPVA
ncbi:nuclear transport factor 2 family protein [Sphingomonas jatrophae]|uniref:SnoaL-like domain-containing protein n=1 Tax=Sphingomonas jatrophae TaxID=1166337 RepID=A0A1I6KK35_9SPHN|nr:nuclear transport factor 2 family protein [Sphingomonas jatrophae]SFR91240.1 SnoaL-like domain-containing protein [Sphingomonas jatrophae]